MGEVNGVFCGVHLIVPAILLCDLDQLFRFFTYFSWWSFLLWTNQIIKILSCHDYAEKMPLVTEFFLNTANQSLFHINVVNTMDKMYEVEFYFIFLGFLVLIKGLLADFKRRLLIIEKTCRIFDSFFVEPQEKPLGSMARLKISICWPRSLFCSSSPIIFSIIKSVLPSALPTLKMFNRWRLGTIWLWINGGMWVWKLSNNFLVSLDLSRYTRKLSRKCTSFEAKEGLSLWSSYIGKAGSSGSGQDIMCAFLVFQLRLENKHFVISQHGWVLLH